MSQDENKTTELDGAVCGRLDALVRRLRYYNNWRRGEDTAQPSPAEIGADIDDAIYAISLMSDAIQKTIAENRHLADGDDCTLRHLVRLFESA